jgi:ribosomal protein S18 acetylase RimI-like enzyme
VTVRRAVPADAARLAALHAERISEGFLPSLGPRFLTRLYRRIATSNHAFAFVVEDDGAIAAFAAGAEDVKALYREFIVRDGIVAGFAALPRLPKAWRRVLETLRYPGSTGALPAAEVLAVATDRRAAGRGYASHAVRSVAHELARRGHRSVKVTLGADNGPALALYRSCGFEIAATIAVHGETPSEVMVWTAP